MICSALWIDTWRGRVSLRATGRHSSGRACCGAYLRIRPARLTCSRPTVASSFHLCRSCFLCPPNRSAPGHRRDEPFVAVHRVRRGGRRRRRQLPQRVHLSTAAPAVDRLAAVGMSTLRAASRLVRKHSDCRLRRAPRPLPHLRRADRRALSDRRSDQRRHVRGRVVVLRARLAARVAPRARMRPDRPLRRRSRAPSPAQRDYASRHRRRLRLQPADGAGMDRLASGYPPRRRQPARDVLRLVVAAGRGGARHGRPEDARDDRRVRRLEDDAADAGVRLVHRIADRRGPDGDRSRPPEIDGAVRLFPRARRGGGGCRGSRNPRLVSVDIRMRLTPGAYALLGMTALVAGLVTILTFALMRFIAAARDARRSLSSSSGGETALLSAALQEAVTKLKAQERAMAARADASERLAGEIVSSLTAGLLVIGLEGEIRILNPAGRRMLDLTDDAPPEEIRRSLKEITLTEVVDECLTSGVAVVRRSVTLPEARHGVSHIGVTVSPLFDDAGQLHGAIC